MSVNSSPPFNSSLLPHPSSNLSLYLTPAICFQYRSTIYSYIALSVTIILLLLPLGLFIFYLGLKRWKKQRSMSTVATSHSDIFTYHMVAMEMIGTFGCVSYCFGIGFKVPWMMKVGLTLLPSIPFGQIFFHVLTCVERYLAVIHPITYLGLRNSGGIRIRNVSIMCVWLVFLAAFFLAALKGSYIMIPAFCLSVFSILVVSFCSLSVLCALIRPGPGDGGKDRDKKSKMRAYYTIMAIMVALLVRLGGHVIALAIYISPSLNERVRCGLLVSGIWLCLPSSLVLPLLFLQRAGKLLCCKNNDSEQGPE